MSEMLIPNPCKSSNALFHTRSQRRSWDSGWCTFCGFTHRILEHFFCKKLIRNLTNELRLLEIDLLAKSPHFPSERQNLEVKCRRHVTWGYSPFVTSPSLSRVHKTQIISANSRLFSSSKSYQSQPRPPPRPPNSGVLPALFWVWGSADE